MIPESPGAIRTTLAELGLRPQKRLGQHFLADQNLRDRIVAEAGVGPGDVVLEVGPGLGILTKGLLDAGALVVAGELDAGLADFLQAELSDRRFRLVRGDAVDGRRVADPLVAALSEERAGAGRFLVVANLPYAISTPLVAGAVALAEPPERIVVMVQREVALRMAGRPGTADYGPLAVLLALAGEVRIRREVGGRAFFPAAPVRSAVVSMELGAVDPARVRLGARAARLAFLHRRKTLRRAMAVSGIDPERVGSAIVAAGADPSDRPEVLYPEQFVLIGRALWPDGVGERFDDVRGAG